MNKIWSEEKQTAFKLAVDTVVSAGAGSGKTAALVELYLRLVSGQTSAERKIPMSEIVAITFTDKAAVEMKERIRSEMRKCFERGDQSQPWDRLIRELSSARISTFHSFTARILRENPLEAGVDPGFTVLDDISATQMADAAVDDVMRRAMDRNSEEMALLMRYFPLEGVGRGLGIRDHLVSLHSLQRGCVMSSEDAVDRMLAMTARARAEYGRAWSELTTSLPEVRRVLASAKRAVFHEPLELYESALAKLPSDPGDEAARGAIAAIQSCVKGNWGKEKPLRDIIVAATEAGMLSAAQVEGEPVFLAMLTLLSDVSESYSGRKRAAGALDFDDLQSCALDLLRDRQDVLARYLEEFSVIMVDEFQDTNKLQKDLISLLSGNGQRLFLVGDPKQSIYLFRGADVSISVAAKREIEAAGGQALYFRESFRSRQGIIDFVNAIFPEVMTGGDHDFDLAFSPDDSLRPMRSDFDGTPCVEMLTADIDKADLDRHEFEAKTMAARILGMVSGQDSVNIFRRNGDGELMEGRPDFGDIAILFRRFSHIKTYEAELRQRNIPYYVVKGKGFYRCQEVLDVLSMLQVVEGEGGVGSFVALMRSPFCALADDTLAVMASGPGGLAAWCRHLRGDLMPDGGFPDIMTDAEREGFELLATAISCIVCRKDSLAIAEIIEDVIAASGYTAALLTTFQGDQKLANVRKLVEISRAFSGGDGGVYRFVDFVERMSDNDSSEPEAVIAAEDEPVVKLMTVHQAKGLEFPVVFVPDVGMGMPTDQSPIKFDEELGFGIRVPSADGFGSESLSSRVVSERRRAKELAEMKRLFYVAATRARDYLVFSGEGRGEWRRWLNGFLDGENASLVLERNAMILSQSEMPEVLVGSEPREHSDAAIAAAFAQSVSFTAPTPEVMTVSTTAIRDFRLCPRKYFYKHVLGLDEGFFSELMFAAGRVLSGEQASELSRLDRGRLVHRILETVRVEDSFDEMRRHGVAIAGSMFGKKLPNGVDDVVESAARFIETNRQRLMSSEFRREFRFSLMVAGCYYLRGVMDLVLFDNGSISVHDYKYKAKGKTSLEQYRFQLGVYMLALAKGYPGAKITGRLEFLEDGSSRPVRVDLAEFEAQLEATLADMRDRRCSSSEFDYPVRQGCTDMFCPFYERCGRGQVAEYKDSDGFVE